MDKTEGEMDLTLLSASSFVSNSTEEAEKEEENKENTGEVGSQAGSDTSGTATENSATANEEPTTEATTAARTETKTYFPVNSTAIMDTINNWNEDHEGTEKYVLVTDKLLTKDEYKPLADEYIDAENNTKCATPSTIEKAITYSGLKLYVKATVGDTKDSDGKTVETGYNYDFLGYYENEGQTYQIVIQPRTATYKSNNNFSVETQTVSSCYQVYLVNATKIENETEENINKMVELVFYDANDSSADLAACDPDNWVKSTVTDSLYTYYYYKDILASGATTTPLLKAVKFKDTFSDDIADAQFDLKVDLLSTQATFDAAAATFGDDDPNVNTAKTFRDFTGIIKETSATTLTEGLNGGEDSSDTIDDSTLIEEVDDN
jgi:hypothetical protein